MLKHITRIKSFGIFGDFQGANLSDFAVFNLIFGWNYSGKTTLSRVFQCLENGKIHEDYADATFSVLTQSGDHWNHPGGPAQNVRVYNEDFRQKHLRWDEVDGFMPILLLGEENIELWSELERNESIRLELEERNADLKGALAAKRTAIGDAETRCARQIVNTLPVGRFDRRNLVPIISSWNGAIPDPISAEVVETAKVSVSAELKEVITFKRHILEDLPEIYKDAKNLLKVSLSDEARIEHLVANPEIGVWVEAGRIIHRDKSQCEFCQNSISESRLRELDAHFSDAFVALKDRISAVINLLSQKKIELEGAAFLRASYYKDLQQKSSEIVAEFQGAAEEFNELLEAFIGELEVKFQNPFYVPSMLSEMPSTARITAASSELHELVKRANERTASFEVRRQEAIELLKGHLVAEEMREIGRFQIEQDVAQLEFNISETSKNEIEVTAAIQQIQGALSNAAKGAEAVNETLVSFFGKNDIRLMVNENERFILMRGDEPAQNLSEGEKSAIAFCYFINKLREDGNSLNETIVYIDDPICSLDSNHLLHVAAFIKTNFYDRHDHHPLHRCHAKQLFISTHNHDFFHLMYDWMKGMKKDDYHVWMIKRTDTENGSSASLMDCPRSITDYRSEYLFIFKQLQEFIDNPEDDAKVIFNVGNMARRLFESYSAFKFFERKGIEGSISKVIIDAVDAERARKFMHLYSHTLSRGGGATLPDVNEAVAIVRTILNSIRDHDPVHFAALEANA